MEWSWLNNPFIAIAHESRARAEKVADYTFAALQARQLDAFFGPRYLTFKPIYDAMKAERTDYGVQKGAQKSGTQSVDDLLKLLSPGKINQWDLQISVVFAPGSPQYVALLPDGHEHFNRGKKDIRIEAVKDLGQALTGIVALAATKTDVDAFYLQLKNARVAQKGSISETKDDSGELTDAMLKCMVALYALLGACIDHFADTPDDIKPIFDISTIRDIAQKTFIDTVTAGDGTEDFVFKRTLMPAQKVKITVLSDKKLRFSITEEKNDPVSTHFVEVDGLEDETFDASQLKVSDVAAFFKVRNTDGSVDGHFKIEIL